MHQLSCPPPTINNPKSLTSQQVRILTEAMGCTDPQPQVCLLVCVNLLSSPESPKTKDQMKMSIFTKGGQVVSDDAFLPSS